MTPDRRRLILLGDSIFDNAAYVGPGEADVTTHLVRELKPAGWEVELRAVDGHFAADVKQQLDARPLDLPCHFVFSAGGNDALEHVGLLDDHERPWFAGETLALLHEIREAFRNNYREALASVLAHAQPLVVCTIYNPSFPEPKLQKAAEAALSLFNDVIQQEALTRCLPVIDLRRVCDRAEHFANPIEPSEAGGERIAAAICEILGRAWREGPA